jgi:quercetin dioxygenase-like cupin family protein
MMKNCKRVSASIRDRWDATNICRHCVDGDTEATLVSAAAEDEHDHDHTNEATSTTSAVPRSGATMTSSVSSAVTGSTNSTASSTSTASRTTTTSAAPTAVTNCHAHDQTELYCLDGSDEWQVTSDWDENNPPESFENCHTHGEEL